MENEKTDVGILWVGIGIGLFTVLSCFALAIYTTPMSVESDAEGLEATTASVEG